jgi:hypothetical protein
MTPPCPQGSLRRSFRQAFGANVEARVGLGGDSFIEELFRAAGNNLTSPLVHLLQGVESTAWTSCSARTRACSSLRQAPPSESSEASEASEPAAVDAVQRVETFQAVADDPTIEGIDRGTLDQLLSEPDFDQRMAEAEAAVDAALAKAETG